MMRNAVASIDLHRTREEARRKHYDRLPLCHRYIVPSYFIFLAGMGMMIAGAVTGTHPLYIGIICIPLSCIYCNIIKRFKGEELRQYNIRRYNASSRHGGQSEEATDAVRPSGPVSEGPSWIGDVPFTSDGVPVVTEFPSPPPYSELPPPLAAQDAPSENGLGNQTNRSLTTTGIGPWGDDMPSSVALSPVFVEGPRADPPSYEEATRDRNETARY